MIRMTDVLRHRGPDDAGYEVFEEPHAAIGLGHRRLSIIDLSPGGHQPMKTEDGSHWIVFNGEVYNYREIRVELEACGHSFLSTSDTEVILKSYKEWGARAVHKFIGMFAFAIYDSQNQKIVLFRDRAGVKPLYYHARPDLFMFASELKSFYEHNAFARNIDRNALGLYFRYGYIPAPLTIFESTHKVKPGHYIEIDLMTGRYESFKYWDVMDHYGAPRLNASLPEAEEEVERLLVSAFQYRMVADVPVGVFLSGGYDSTTVVALLQKNMTSRLKTFTIGFHEDAYNEAREAQQIARYLGTDHHEHYCTAREAQELIPQIPFFYDEPYADSSAIPTMLVSRHARQSVTVALSADGGDETFAGYNNYDRYLYLHRRIEGIPPLLRRRLARVLPALFLLSSYKGCNSRVIHLLALLQNARMLEEDHVYSLIHLLFYDYKINRLLPRSFDDSSLRGEVSGISGSDMDLLHQLMAYDYKVYMVDDVLTKVDRATMSVSLEGREPLLDHRIIELVSRLPVHFKYQDGRKKILLKKILGRHIPLDKLIGKKKGFTIPLESWLTHDLRDVVEHYFSTENLSRHDLFDVTYVRSLKDRVLKEKKGAGNLWFPLVFQMWYMRHMASPSTVRPK